MKMKLVTVLVAVTGLAAASALLAQGCCEGGAMKQGCSMGGMAGQAGHAGSAGAATAASPVKPVFPQPVQSVFDNYIKVQSALAQDSLQGLSTAGTAMANAIQADSQHALSAKVAEQAEALGTAKDLDTARAAFKALSQSLIEFVKGQKSAAGTYHVAYCPMAKASWLQTGTTVMNPYMGQAMPHCGQLKS
jgi:Protein of unknown function (DUF3347)